MLAADPLACVLVAVTAVGDAEATERVDAAMAFARDGVGLLAVSATSGAVDTWMVGAPVNTLGVWGPTVGRGLTVEGPGVRLAGSCVPRGLLAFAEGAAAVGALEASGTREAAPGDVPLLGAWVRGLLGVAVEDGAGPGDVGEGSVGCPEAGRSGPPATIAGVPVSVLGALPAVTSGELGLAPRAPAATGLGEGGVVRADVVLKALSAASLGVLSGTTLSPVRLRAGDP